MNIYYGHVDNSVPFMPPINDIDCWHNLKQKPGISLEFSEKLKERIANNRCYIEDNYMTKREADIYILFLQGISIKEFPRLLDLTRGAINKYIKNVIHRFHMKTEENMINYLKKNHFLQKYNEGEKSEDI